MKATQPDLFSNAHKGIRKALFDAGLALGRAGDDPQRSAAARSILRDAVRFVRHHGENEDLLLLPLIRGRAPRVFERMASAHARIDEALASLARAVDGEAGVADLYHRTAAFTALYLEHMREEEQDLELELRSTFTAEELALFGRGAIARTSPADRAMMIGYMLPALTEPDFALFSSINRSPDIG